MNKIVISLAFLLLQACAFTDATLDVSHSADANFEGPISSVEAVSFSAPVISDDRQDPDRIGFKKNGYGANTADIMTKTPVNEIVSNGLVAGLSANNQSVIENGRVAISGSLKKFWLEMDVNFWTVEFIGDVQCELIFTDTQSNKQIFSSIYNGTYSEKKAAGLEGTWTEIMGKAVDKLVEDVMFDEELTEALQALE